LVFGIDIKWNYLALTFVTLTPIDTILFALISPDAIVGFAELVR
jgi:hypothetical protein